jgi:hypothetical protein
MQRALHNRATIRVADRTDLSGRVTADDVNLERIHYSIRKVCALGRTWLALVTASMGLYLVLPDRGLAQNQNDQGIKPGVPNGTYVFTNTGFFVPTPTNGLSGQVALAAAGRETFFANGTTRGIASFSFGGDVFSVTLKGTFTPNGDGSFSATSTNSLGTVINLILYPTPDGNTIAFVQTDAGSITNGVLTRGSQTGGQQ